jgi:hypothetical protein
MSFFRRAIDLTFPDLNKTVSGLRVQCQTEVAVGPGMGRAQVRVYGLTKSDMLQLASNVRLANGKLVYRQNRLVINAGDLPISGPAEPLQQIFQGQITSAMILLSDQPNSIFEMSAYTGAYEASVMIPPRSYPGPVAAENILADLAALATPPFTFENNGCHEILGNTYLVGSIRDQMLQTIRATETFAWNALDNGILAIWPKNGFRSESTSSASTVAAPTILPTPSTPPDQIIVTAPLQIPLISPATGMVGYPTNWNLAGGLFLTTEFNFDLHLGKRCKVESELPFANGIYVMYDIAHDLESEMPDGAWYTTLHAAPWPSSDIAPATPPTP